MSQSYEEIVRGESLLRSAPDPRHERICSRLHQRIESILPAAGASRLLAARSIIALDSGTLLRPDLALVTAASGKLWLAAEIVSSRDHRIDTVVKKTIYEEANLPRLWMIDPRYDNVEVYHGGPYGLVLRTMLAGADRLTESLLPSLNLTARDLFAAD